MQEKVNIVDSSGQNHIGTQLFIEESTQRPSDIKLSDGTVFRLNPSIVNVVVLDNQWDDNGNPVYHLDMKMDVSVFNVPTNRRKSQE